jgi:ribonuclease PH
VKRTEGRGALALRPVSISYDVYPYADGSVLYEAGNTKVLVSVSLQKGVPPFLRFKKEGWLTAEYAMLPSSTQVRTPREASQAARNGRSMEISRLIGRALRSACKPALIVDHTIIIDCDVLCADGSTRCASLNGAALALERAQRAWLQRGIIAEPLVLQQLRAVSVGVDRDASLLLDLDYAEDMRARADFTFVLTQKGDIIEVQGTAEKSPVSWETYAQVCHAAQEGLKQVNTELERYSVASNEYTLGTRMALKIRTDQGTPGL